MASKQKRLKLNRSARHAWTTKEQLCLASGVLKSGDHKWLKISQFLKSFLQKEFQRPRDWFSKKCCASQYAHLLEKANALKKKQGKIITGHTIVRRLTEERKTEISLLLASQRDEYQQLKYELNFVKTGNLTEEELQKMCLQIELGEQELEQEQKRKTQTISLAKSQEQVEQTPRSFKFVIPKKPRSSDRYCKLDPSKTIMEENNKHGRSLLLNNLLKSELTLNKSPQFHQLVPSTIANATSERSSFGAPNISMLLELPASLQRTILPNLELQTSTTNLSGSNLNLQMISKDLMADDLEKNEINKIIEDVEKLTMKETTDNSQVLDSKSVEVKNSLMSELPLLPDKQEIKNVPATRYFSDSPESDIEIEEIDPSSSNIAEIIGIVGKFPIEDSKSGEEVEAKKSSMSSEESKNKEAEDGKGSELIEDLKVGIEEITEGKPCEEGLELIKDLMVEIEEIKVGNKSEKDSELTEDPKVEIEETTEVKESDKENIIAPFMDELKKSTFKKEYSEMCAEKDTEKSLKEDREESAKDDVKNEIQENEKENVLQNLEESPYKKMKMTFERENLSEKNVTMDIKKVDDNEDVDQLELELNLAKITGDENAPSTEVLNIFSHDLLSVEDPSDLSVEQSQEIIWILEHANIELSLQEKVIKDEENLATEPVEKVAEPSASKEDFTIIKEERKEDEMEELGEYDTKDFSDRTLIAEVIVDDFKDLEEEEREMAERSDPLKETEDLQSEDNLFMDKEIKIELPKDEYEFCEETSTDEEMKEMKDEEKDNLDEKELTLKKRSEGRVMKTYSKKKTTAVKRDSEMEGSKESSEYRAWKKAVMLVYDRLATYKYSSVFFKPITEDQASGYSSIIFRPMDLTTIKKNIDNGTIRSTKHFQRDVMLMCQNAIMYNKRNSSVYKMAISMQEEFLQDIQILEEVSREVSSCREAKRSASISSEASESNIKKRSCNTSYSGGAGSSRRNKRSKLAKH